MNKGRGGKEKIESNEWSPNRAGQGRRDGVERCIAWICMSRFITLPRHTSMEEKKREAANLFTHRLLLPFSTEASLRCVYIYLHKRSFKARGYFLDPASLTLYIYFLPSSKKLESSIFFDQRYSRSHNTCDRCFYLFEGLWRICSEKNEFGIILNCYYEYM